MNTPDRPASFVDRHSRLINYTVGLSIVFGAITVFASQASECRSFEPNIAPISVSDDCPQQTPLDEDVQITERDFHEIVTGYKQATARLTTEG